MIRFIVLKVAVQNARYVKEAVPASVKIVEVQENGRHGCRRGVEAAFKNLYKQISGPLFF